MAIFCWRIKVALDEAKVARVSDFRLTVMENSPCVDLWRGVGPGTTEWVEEMVDCRVVYCGISSAAKSPTSTQRSDAPRGFAGLMSLGCCSHYTLYFTARSVSTEQLAVTRQPRRNRRFYVAGFGSCSRIALRIYPTMISDTNLYSLSIFLGSASMLLIVLYHFLEINAKENTTADGNRSTKIPSAAVVSPERLADAIPAGKTK
nr:hypothetical protein CFP56_23823 [Quercus suber]